MQLYITLRWFTASTTSFVNSTLELPRKRNKNFVEPENCYSPRISRLATCLFRTKREVLHWGSHCFHSIFCFAPGGRWWTNRFEQRRGNFAGIVTFTGVYVGFTEENMGGCFTSDVQIVCRCWLMCFCYVHRVPSVLDAINGGWSLTHPILHGRRCIRKAFTRIMCILYCNLLLLQNGRVLCLMRYVWGFIS